MGSELTEQRGSSAIASGSYLSPVVFQIEPRCHDFSQKQSLSVADVLTSIASVKGSKDGSS